MAEYEFGTYGKLIVYDVIYPGTDYNLDELYEKVFDMVMNREGVTQEDIENGNASVWMNNCWEDEKMGRTVCTFVISLFKDLEEI